MKPNSSNRDDSFNGFSSFFLKKRYSHIYVYIYSLNTNTYCIIFILCFSLLIIFNKRLSLLLFMWATVNLLPTTSIGYTTKMLKLLKLYKILYLQFFQLSIRLALIRTLQGYINNIKIKSISRS